MKEEENKVNEPQVEYKKADKAKTITFYNSPVEMEDDRWMFLASRTYEQRLSHLEEMRKVQFRKYLQADGTFPPLKRIITIIKDGK